MIRKFDVMNVCDIKMRWMEKGNLSEIDCIFLGHRVKYNDGPHYSTRIYRHPASNLINGVQFVLPMQKIEWMNE